MNDLEQKIKQSSDSYATILCNLMKDYEQLTTDVEKANDSKPFAVNKLRLIDGLMKTLKMEKDTLRSAIAEDMITTGEFQVDAGRLKASLVKGRDNLVVTDEKLLKEKNPQFFETKEVLNKSLVKRTLEFKDVEGAQLDKTEPTLSIRKRK